MIISLKSRTVGGGLSLPLSFSPSFSRSLELDTHHSSLSLEIMLCVHRQAIYIPLMRFNLESNVYLSKDLAFMTQELRVCASFQQPAVWLMLLDSADVRRRWDDGRQSGVLPRVTNLVSRGLKVIYVKPESIVVPGLAGTTRLLSCNCPA